MKDHQFFILGKEKRAHDVDPPMDFKTVTETVICKIVYKTFKNCNILVWDNLIK